MTTRARDGVPVKAAALAAFGYAGGAMCIVLIFLGMRSVMDIGGFCAEGGPYVIAQGCPDAATPSLLLGMFGLFLFGAIATGYGIRSAGSGPLRRSSAGRRCSACSAGTSWSTACSIRAGRWIELGWAICGVVFWLMAAGPLIALLPLGAALRTAPSDVVANRQARKEAKLPYEPDPATGTIIRIIGPDGVRVVPADDPEAQEQMAAIAAAMEAALDKVEGITPALVSDDPSTLAASRRPARRRRARLLARQRRTARSSPRGPRRSWTGSSGSPTCATVGSSSPPSTRPRRTPSCESWRPVNDPAASARAPRPAGIHRAGHGRRHPAVHLLRRLTDARCASPRRG